MQSTERSVLGAALSAPGLWLSQAERINPDLFVEHAALAKHLCAMTEAGHPTDPQAVKAWLDARQIQIGMADLLELSELAPASSAGMESAVDALVDRSKRGALRRLAGTIDSLALDARHQPDDIIEETTRKLAEIGARSTRAVESLAHALPRVVIELSRPPADAVKTGLGSLDKFTGGFRPGQLIVLGARPSMGKTSFAVGLLRQAALSGKTVALFSLEMSCTQVIHRLLADVGNVDLARLSQHRLSEQMLSSITVAAAHLHKTRVFIGETDHGLPQVCAQIKAQHGLDLVIVDYLQLMQCRAESREQQVATLARNLKRMARNVGVPVLVLSQLNRSLEARQCKRPQLSDLRESGAIEQDADIVLLLWRPAYYATDADPTEAELVVAKQRNGPVGTMPLVWDETRARFNQAKSQ